MSSILGIPLEYELALHSSILAWKIPEAEDPGGLQSVGPQRVRHDSATGQTHTHTDSLLEPRWVGGARENKISPGHVRDRIAVGLRAWAPESGGLGSSPGPGSCCCATLN